MPFSYTEPHFCIADIYKTVELQAYHSHGREMILVRCVFPPGFKYAHLIPEKVVPFEYLSTTDIIERVESIDDSTPVHFVADDPIICGVGPLVAYFVSKGRQVYLGSNGFINLPGDLTGMLTGFYLNTKPGLPPTKYNMDFANEIRAYNNPNDEESNHHIAAMDEYVVGKNRDKLFLIPYYTDDETMGITLKTAMTIGWRFGVALAALKPDLDRYLLHNVEAEKAYHDRYYNGTKPTNALSGPNTELAPEKV